jgi:hypothetical protein
VIGELCFTVVTLTKEGTVGCLIVKQYSNFRFGNNRFLSLYGMTFGVCGQKAIFNNSAT